MSNILENHGAIASTGGSRSFSVCTPIAIFARHACARARRTVPKTRAAHRTNSCFLELHWKTRSSLYVDSLRYKLELRHILNRSTEWSELHRIASTHSHDDSYMYGSRLELLRISCWNHCSTVPYRTLYSTSTVLVQNTNTALIIRVQYSTVLVPRVPVP